MFLYPSYGFMQSVGTVQSYLQLNQLSDYTARDLGWISGIFTSLGLLLGIQAGPLMDAYGTRLLAPISAATLVPLFFLLGECTKYWHFILCLGVLGGISSALTSTVAMAVIGKLFSRRRGLAMGMALSGSSFGGVTLSMMFRSLLPKLGWQWTMRATGFLVLGIMVLGVICFLPFPTLTASSSSAPLGAPTLHLQFSKIMGDAQDIQGGTGVRPHPLDPLYPEEISIAADIIRRSVQNEQVFFRAISLAEPPKQEMTAFLDGQQAGDKALAHPVRRARVQAYIGKTLHEVMVDLNAATIMSKAPLPGKHSFIDTEFMAQVAAACLADSGIQQEIETLKLPEGATVVVEPWAYATDGMKDMKDRWTMAWFYMRLSDNPDANYYAYPLDICAEVSNSLEVVKIYRLPSGEHDKIHEEKLEFDRRKIHSDSEYHPDFVQERRTTTKPYHVSQPEGPSFSIDGNHISWEKWTMRVGFNYREGMTLHDVRFEGRSLFYRLSLSEMFVPYGDPRCPYPRKAAFDLGNDGAGINANNLKLGCDCLGHIKYFDGWLSTSSGEPLKMPNVICCHEIDDGILWKHTNFRTGNAVVTRSRVLVLQTIITVSNYEYIFLFYFQQDGSVFYEVRATGIMSTAPIDIDAKVPWGTVVAPGVLAPYHQHIFCLRIDPAIDGNKNSLVVEESQPIPCAGDSDEYNPFGVGYTTKSEYVKEEAGLDLDFNTNRTFKIVNEGVTNPTTGTPVGFKLLPHYSQLLLAHPNSWHGKRSEYTSHAVWVTRHQDEELFPAGRFTMQSSGGEGIASWIKQRKEESLSSVRNEDIVVWHTFGSTHNPRIEDWPVMPCEKMMVGLKPVNFFQGNPALDVPISTQDKNRSVLVHGGD
ncbi:Copper amine oxidase 1 [Colletotrichum sp. SAR 10_75]|nr:Copper amine oxidase 1 [Colletotrichum sp. SAR 10_75]